MSNNVESNAYDRALDFKIVGPTSPTDHALIDAAIPEITQWLEAETDYRFSEGESLAELDQEERNTRYWSSLHANIFMRWAEATYARNDEIGASLEATPWLYVGARLKAGQHLMTLCADLQAARVWQGIADGYSVDESKSLAMCRLGLCTSTLRNRRDTLFDSAVFDLDSRQVFPRDDWGAPGFVTKMFPRAVALGITYLIDLQKRSGSMQLPKPGTALRELKIWDKADIDHPARLSR